MTHGMPTTLLTSQFPNHASCLAALGELLGATEPFKPNPKGRTDAVWIWETMWIRVEATRARLTWHHE